MIVPRAHIPVTKNLELSDAETPALINLLKRTIVEDRYPLSPRVRTLLGIFNKLRPVPARPAASREPGCLCGAAGKRSQETPPMKLPPPKPGEQRYAVAIQDGSDLWLTLWVRCSQAGDIFVMLPRQDPDFDVHTSYHRNGKSHTKTLLPSRGYLDKPIHSTKRQPLTAGFKGIEHLVNFSGHGKGTGAVCDPKAFDGVVYVEPNILAPHGGSVAVDLVEPGYKLKLEPGGPKRQLFPRGSRPSVVITIYPADQDPLWWKYLKWPDDFVKVENIP